MCIKGFEESIDLSDEGSKRLAVELEYPGHEDGFVGVQIRLPQSSDVGPSLQTHIHVVENSGHRHATGFIVLHEVEAFEDEDEPE